MRSRGRLPLVSCTSRLLHDRERSISEHAVRAQVPPHVDREGTPAAHRSSSAHHLTGTDIFLVQGKGWMHNELMKGMPKGVGKNIMISSLRSGRRKQMVLQVRKCVLLSTV